MKKSKRFEILRQRPVNKDSFVQEWPEAGLSTMSGPYDPQPNLMIEDGRIIEMDGKREQDFDLIDRFIADHCIDIKTAPRSMALDSLKVARMLVDINVPRKKIIQLVAGMTPAKILEVVSHLNVVEMMMAVQKMRARKSPANQAHVTNKKEHPALLAADAAEAALRGFAEIETTVGVSRYAPLNALSILIGSQTGKGGTLTQCAVEESLGLQLSMLGLTSYAETLSIYGTEKTLVDGDDSPYSKAFLASAYASRGTKIRFTSGTGSEALMGHAEQKSMLYLETRCIMMVKGAGSQGVQNGSISLIALPQALPGGVRMVLAENLIAMMLDLEVASGNDAMSSHSDMRKAGKLMLQFLPGTDFICSGYGAIPRRDNLFGGGNFDAEDFDDYLVLQRDMQVDGGMEPVTEEEVLIVRERAARAIQLVFEEFHFNPITDGEVESATTGHSSEDVPARDKVADIEAADRILHEPIPAIKIVKALANRGFNEIAGNIVSILKQRISGDYLQTSGILDSQFLIHSAITEPNDYSGPGTGYRLRGERWEKLKNIPQAPSYQHYVESIEAEQKTIFKTKGVAEKGSNPHEVIVALGPAFGTSLTRTINGLKHREILCVVREGIEKEGGKARFVKIVSTADCAFIGHQGAQLSGSGISIGIQSKGTAVIHQKDLQPLNNLELFPQAPSLTLEHYRRIGQNAARYAKKEIVSPIPITIDNMARLRLIIKTTILHNIEIQSIQQGKEPVEVELVS